ncbi:hypothetical protein L6164_005488 [Bauhinia variegata]|uniref:Uncharacterized protein n=1 Tax=Bauhinia variegata TaxID=167791 RepID=A0ACB9PQS1_BAUVA|nr:hypothetical protein L6164_005488 [Bauhinia variegata]
MAVSSRGRRELFPMEKKISERETSPERNRIWIQPKPKAAESKVSVIYYLSKDSHLEHPHLIEVPLSSSQGILCLKDVMNRLNFLRGQGMANMYSWSAKRSYKSGFVWQDLSENDFIYPCNANEYVLKGTKLIDPETCSSFRSYENGTVSPPIAKSESETNSSSTADADSPAVTSINSKNLSSENYQFYRAKPNREISGKLAVNASTQTEEKGRRRGIKREDDEEECEGNEGSLGFSMEGNCGGSRDIRDQTVENDRPSGRMKASTVLMQLIRCGSSKRFENCGFEKEEFAG